MSEARDIFAALSAANVRCSGYSSDGVDVWGDTHARRVPPPITLPRISIQKMD